jgi:glycosyltransferase involved in cell wall biosynthesis
MTPISAVIITYNEERNIGRCLASLQSIADEIIVIDSFSKDKTKEICLNYDVKFIELNWLGYSESKNFGNKQALYPWILSLDADEVLSEKLIQSILEKKKKGLKGNYSFNRLTNYCGKWIKYGGWYPDNKTRIFNRENAEWVGKIHETLQFNCDNSITHLNGDCLHYSYYTIEEHINQTIKFSTQTAKMLHEKGKKSNLIKRFFSPFFKFIKDYFFKLCILHGITGFRICIISAYATYLKYKTLHELNKIN